VKLSAHRLLFGIFVSLLAAAIFSAVPAFAATITVTSLADSGPGSLRDSIASASPGDTINFGVTGTITLTSGELLISKNLTISGPGTTNSVAIDGGSNSRVFEIAIGTTVVISGLTVQNGGVGDFGGGILNNGVLTLSNTTLTVNYAFLAGGGIYNATGATLAVGNSTISNTPLNSFNAGNFASAGDGIYNATGGTLTVTDSTLSGNGSSRSATPACKAGSICVFGGGGIYNAGTLTVTNTTLSDNHGFNNGGGIYNDSGATLRLTNSTLSGNGVVGAAQKACTPGLPCPSQISGGIYNDPSGSIAAKNTILSNNSPANCASDSSSSGPLSSDGYNLSDDAFCSSYFVQTGDLNISNLPPAGAGLDPNGLQNNGGPTQTIALLATSPAVDAIPVSACTDFTGTAVSTDQRGVTRPQGSACDIGAFELVPPYVAQVQQPINPDGSSVFKAKRGVVPVKFTMTQGGIATCQLPPATISLNRTGGMGSTLIDESSYLLASDSGSNFRIDSSACQYVYNLATSSLGTGTYVVSISIAGSAVGSGTFGLQ
jgi:hypothetical protein